MFWKSRLCLGTLLSLAFIELTVSSIPLLGWVGAALYVFAHALLAATGIACIFKAPRNGLTVASVLFLISVIAGCVYFAGLPSSISGETPQEIACILMRLKSDVSAGYNSSCFLGYPARQYYVPAIPSILFGHSQHSLNIGFLFPLWIGLILFFCGVKDYCGTRLRGLAAGVLSVLLFLQSGHFIFLLLNFEQAILPFSYSLMVIGLLMLFAKSRQFHFLILSAVATYLSIFSYTPALALVAGELLILFTILLFTKRVSTRMLMSALLATLFFGAQRSLSMRNDIRLGLGSDWHQFKSILYEGISQLVQSKGATGLFSPLILVFILLGYLGLITSAFRFKFIRNHRAVRLLWILLVTIAWSAVTIIVSITSNGYARPAPIFASHRALLILPLIIALGVTGFSFISLLSMRRARHLYSTILLILIATTAYSDFDRARDYLQLRQPDQKLWLSQWLRDQQKDKPIPLLLFEKSEESTFQNLNDFLPYFVGSQLRYRFLSTCDAVNIFLTEPIILISRPHFCQRFPEKSHLFTVVQTSEVPLEIRSIAANDM